LRRWLTYELKAADYLSFRDEGSAAVFAETAGSSAANVATDLVFLSGGGATGHVRTKDSLRLGAILRSSNHDADRIAADLIRMNEDIENLVLVPVAFQPGEDESVWRRAGWQGEILFAENPAEVFAQFDLVVTMRLHACIVATSLSIPWLGIAYDPKVSAFAAACRWQLCCQPSEAVRSLLDEKLNLMAGRRAELADRLHRLACENHRIASADFARMLQAVVLSDQS